MRLWMVVVLLCCAVRVDAVTIAVGGETFLVETFPISASVTETTPLPLDLDVDARSGNTIYMVAEFDRRIYSVARTATDGTTLTTIAIEAPSSPLFRGVLADVGSFLSAQQEHIATTPDGSVWVSQGGLILYGGTKNNWSRIMRRKLDTTWEAYTLPVDSAGAIGFYVNPTANNNAASNLWVMAGADNAMYHTRLRNWHEGETAATRYPPVDTRWFKIRDLRRNGGHPAHLIQLRDGRLAGTLYWGEAVFLYNLNDESFTFVDLTPFAGDALGSKPWQLRQHPDGNLWIVEDAAKRVTKYDLSTGAQTLYDFSASLGATEYAHSIAFDGTDAYVTTYNSTVSGSGTARLVKITNAGTITAGASFSTISLGGGLTGIEVDSAGKLWVCLFQQRAIARLTRQ